MAETRREFLKQSAALVGGAVTAGILRPRRIEYQGAPTDIVDRTDIEAAGLKLVAIADQQWKEGETRMEENPPRVETIQSEDGEMVGFELTIPAFQLEGTDRVVWNLATTEDPKEGKNFGSILEEEDIKTVKAPEGIRLYFLTIPTAFSLYTKGFDSGKNLLAAKNLIPVSESMSELTEEAFVGLEISQSGLGQKVIKGSFKAK